ncbi:unnamed protein product [marine sediment metagenome]|uniref:Uncharacterized protein n=1 Tax=marine sediment metagenome TaxID=412755 RepID=X1KCH4_9ZZZZ
MEREHIKRELEKIFEDSILFKESELVEKNIKLFESSGELIDYERLKDRLVESILDLIFSKIGR